MVHSYCNIHTYIDSKARQSLQLNLDVYIRALLLDRYVTLYGVSLCETALLLLTNGYSFRLAVQHVYKDLYDWLWD